MGTAKPVGLRRAEGVAGVDDTTKPGHGTGRSGRSVRAVGPARPGGAGGERTPDAGRPAGGSRMPPPAGSVGNDQAVVDSQRSSLCPCLAAHVLRVWLDVWRNVPMD